MKQVSLAEICFFFAFSISVFGQQSNANLNEVSVRSNAVAGKSVQSVVRSADKGILSAETLANVISFINLLIVALVYRDSVRVRTEDRKARELEKTRDTQRQTTIFWIQDLILSPHIDSLHEFFNKYEREMERLGDAGRSDSNDQNVAKASIIGFKREFHRIKSRVVEPLTWIGEEFKPLQGTMAEIEDLVTNEYAKMTGVIQTSKESSSEAKLRTLRETFFKTIREAQDAVFKA